MTGCGWLLFFALAPFVVAGLLVLFVIGLAREPGLTIAVFLALFGAVVTFNARGASR
jgi:hypothetical protein